MEEYDEDDISELVDDWTAQYDKNGDGMIDEEEYLEIMISLLMKKKGLNFIKTMFEYYRCFMH